ncbi:hypothetical protein CP967_06005 [Streptomyces nitrosporeus]|uniref:Uncharacterized protein n=1 Tax=Streptomyces nitrosporeus TaxID=28894 RepID=A0A5J6F6E1_9ACTN|nr:hypothetical protein CP967_06005 [Streptomyces nitrosporeus]
MKVGHAFGGGLRSSAERVARRVLARGPVRRVGALGVRGGGARRWGGRVFGGTGRGPGWPGWPGW